MAFDCKGPCSVTICLKQPLRGKGLWQRVVAKGCGKGTWQRPVAKDCKAGHLKCKTASCSSWTCASLSGASPSPIMATSPCTRSSSPAWRNASTTCKEEHETQPTHKLWSMRVATQLTPFLSLFTVNLYGHHEHGHTRSLVICGGGMTCDS